MRAADANGLPQGWRVFLLVEGKSKGSDCVKRYVDRAEMEQYLGSLKAEDIINRMWEDGFLVEVYDWYCEMENRCAWREINELRLRGLPKWLNEGMRHEGLK